MFKNLLSTGPQALPRTSITENDVAHRLFGQGSILFILRMYYMWYSSEQYDDIS